MKHWVGSALFLLVGLSLGLLFIDPSVLVSPYSKIAERILPAFFMILLSALAIYHSRQNRALKDQIEGFKK